MSNGPQWEPVDPAPSPPAGPQPMRVGQVIEVGLRILRRHWPVALLLALLFAGPGALLSSATSLRLLGVLTDVFPGIEAGVVETDMTITQAELDRVIEALVPYFAASLLAGVLLSLGALAFAAVVAADYHAHTPTLGQALRACLRRTPSALAFIVLTSLLIVAVAITGLLGMSLATTALPPSSMTAGGPGVFLALVVGVAAVVVVIYLTMRWAPAFPAMVEEDIGAREALRRSWHLSGDNVWRILVVSLFAALVTALAGSVLSQLFVLLLVEAVAPTLGLEESVAESIGLALGSLILAPLAPVLTAVLYFDLRARRDVPAPPAPAPDPYR